MSFEKEELFLNQEVSNSVKTQEQGGRTHTRHVVSGVLAKLAGQKLYHNVYVSVQHLVQETNGDGKLVVWCFLLFTQFSTDMQLLCCTSLSTECFDESTSPAVAIQ